MVVIGNGGGLWCFVLLLCVVVVVWWFEYLLFVGFQDFCDLLDGIVWLFIVVFDVCLVVFGKCLVEQDVVLLVDGLYYEECIVQGCIVICVGNWYDLFNVLVWVLQLQLK